MAVAFSALDFINHFIDVNDSLTKIQVVNLPNNGELKLLDILVIDGQEINVTQINDFNFIPVLNWNGNTSFEWKGHDKRVYSENVANVNIMIFSVNDVPVLGSTAGDAAYTEDQPAVVVDNTFVITDVDSTALTGAQIAITNYKTADVLEFTPNGGIIGSYNPSTGILTLAGIASLSEYQTTLQSVKYKTTSDDPDTTTREITFTVNDGTDNSNVITKNVAVTAVNDVPVLGSTAGDAAYTEDQPAVVVDNTFVITDVDSTALTGAQIAITNYKTADVLEFTPNGGIIGSYNPSTGILTLAGIASLSEYQTTLQSVKYKTTSDDPDTTTRTITFTVTDGADDSNIITKNVSVTAVNDMPILGNNFMRIEQGQTLTLSKENLSATDVDNEDSKLTFIMNNVLYGQFELFGGRGVAIYEFTQQQIYDGNVNFVHDGSTFSPSYSVSVSDGSLTTNSILGMVDFVTPESPYCEEHPFVCYVAPPIISVVGIVVAVMKYLHKKQLWCFKKATPVSQTNVPMTAV